MRTVAAALALCLAAAGVRAEQGVTLRPIVPDTAERATLQRAIVQAGAAGLTDPETFANASFLIVRDGATLGAFVSGRATDARVDGHEKTCFQALVRPGTAAPDLLPTVGRWPWAAENCHGVKGVGALPASGREIRIGVLYHAAAATSDPTEPVVFVWRPGEALSVDTEATRRCVTAGAETIAQMRAALAATR